MGERRFVFINHTIGYFRRIWVIFPFKIVHITELSPHYFMVGDMPYLCTISLEVSLKKLRFTVACFHSIPAAVLSSLITLSILNIYIDSVDLKLLFSISVGIGYLCHLVLDELNSAVNLGGMPFVPNKSLCFKICFKKQSVKHYYLWINLIIGFLSKRVSTEIYSIELIFYIT